MYYIHKHEVQQCYGGPEEGGWWYTRGEPVPGWVPPRFLHEEYAYSRCRELNDAEHARAKRDEDYGFSSVLAHRSTHYSYSVEDFPTPVAFPAERPHYE